MKIKEQTGNTIELDYSCLETGLVKIVAYDFFRKNLFSQELQTSETIEELQNLLDFYLNFNAKVVDIHFEASFMQCKIMVETSDNLKEITVIVQSSGVVDSN